MDQVLVVGSSEFTVSNASFCVELSPPMTKIFPLRTATAAPDRGEGRSPGSLDVSHVLVWKSNTSTAGMVSPKRLYLEVQRPEAAYILSPSTAAWK